MPTTPVSLLFLQTGMLGVFMALDFFLFYMFWEVMLVPMYFLIGIWGAWPKLCTRLSNSSSIRCLARCLCCLGHPCLYFQCIMPEYGTGQAHL